MVRFKQLSKLRLVEPPMSNTKSDTNSSSKPSYKRLSKPLAVLFLVVATELIGFGLFIPVLPQIVTRFNVSGWMIGILLSAYSLAQFIAAPYLGSLSDRIGRKPVLIASKLGTVLAYCILAATHSYGWFLIARLIDGFTGGNISVARAYVADVTTPETRSRGMAVIGIAFGLGFLLGPALGGFLFQSESYVIPALVCAGLSGIATLFTVLFLEEPSHKTVTERRFSFRLFKEVLSMPVVGLFCGMQLLYMIVFSGFETTFSLFSWQTFQFSEHQNSLLFFYIGILALFVQGYLSRKSFKKLALVISTGLGLVGIGFFAMGFVTQLSFLLGILVIFSIGIGLVNVFLPTLISVNAPSDSQGKIMGVYESLGSLARVIGPLIPYGLSFDHFSVVYRVYAVVVLLLAVAAIQYNSKSISA